VLKKSFLAQVLLTAITGVCNADTYTIVDLGTLGGKQSFAYSVNDANVVVGSSSGKADSNNITPFSNHAYIATIEPVTMTDLGHLGGNDSTAFFVDSTGLVYGQSSESIGGTSRGFVHDGVLISNLGLPTGATQFRALAKEGSGLVIGYSNVDIDTNATDTLADFRLRAVVRNASGAFTFLDMPKDGTTVVTKGSAVARSINSAKQIVGYASPEDSSNLLHPVRWDFASGTAVVDLGTLGGSAAQANDINDSGLVVGLSQVSGNKEVQPFVYDASQTTAMKGLGQIRSEMNFGEAYAINNSNEIVGTSMYATGLRQRAHATYYKYNTAASAGASDNKLMDLNSLLSCEDQEQWELTEARDINNFGVIVGHGVRKKQKDSSGQLVDVGEIHAFLLKPAAAGASAPTCPVTDTKKDSGGSMPVLMMLFSVLLWWRRKA